MKLMTDPVTGLTLPEELIDHKRSLKHVLDSLVDKTVMANQHRNGRYFISLHAKFEESDPEIFKIDEPKITTELPPFMSNSFVFYVDNKQSICELLWMVPPKVPGGKLKPEFNTNGVAYLKAKGAMPS